MQLGKLGVWYPMDRLDGDGIRALLGTIERTGYAAVWYPEARGYESLSLASFLLAHSTELVVGSSIASIYARDAFTARRGMVGLNQLYGARFILGLGVSHIPMVEGLRGHTYEKPLPAMRAYLDALTAGETGTQDWPVVIAALGPKMLELAGARTQGAIPYNTTPRHTAAARAKLPAGKWLAVEQKVSLETDPVRARALGRKELARYMVLPNYRNSWLGMGFTEAGPRRRRQRPLHRRNDAVGRRRHGEGRTARPFRRRCHASLHPAGPRRGRHRDPRPNFGGAGGHMRQP